MNSNQNAEIMETLFEWLKYSECLITSFELQRDDIIDSCHISTPIGGMQAWRKSKYGIVTKEINCHSTKLQI